MFEKWKNQLLKTTNKLVVLVEGNPLSLEDLVLNLDRFAEIVRRMGLSAITERQSLLLNEINSYILAEEELAVIILIILDDMPNSTVSSLLSSYKKDGNSKMVSVLEKFISPESIQKRQQELRENLAKLQNLLSK